METWGWIILIAAALFIGLAAQYVMRRGTGYEWMLVAAGAGVGGYVASEYDLGGLGKWGTEIAGMYLFPALIGALLVAAIVAIVLIAGERTNSRT